MVKQYNGRYQLLGVASYVTNGCADPSRSYFATLDRIAITDWIAGIAGQECGAP